MASALSALLVTFLPVVDARDFDGFWSAMSLSRTLRSSASSRVRPSWVSEARLKLMSVPSALVKVSGARVMRPARVRASR